MTEHQLQSECVKWFYQSNHRFTHIKCLFSVNNNSESRSSGMKQKSLGVVAGVSDLIFISVRKVYFIEIKLESGTQNKEQMMFHGSVASKGHLYFIVRSLQEFIDLITKIISNE